jgi:superfamily I DNA and/or RNA helicase
VIILTTVQSNSKSIGFLKNDKRLNVSLTRAQSLMIIIGNSNTLRTSPMWSKFVEYCEKNGSVVYPKNEKNDNILSSILPDSKLTIKKDENKKKNNRRGSKSKISQIRY